MFPSTIQKQKIDSSDGASMGPSPHQINTAAPKRSWVRMHTDDMLKLEAATKFGLPAYVAGKIVLGDHRNASRTLQSLHEMRRRKESTLNGEVWREWNLEQKTEKQKVKLEALLQVSKAREHGIISQKNIMKMDQKVNLSVSKILQKTNPEICQACMPESVELEAQGVA